MKQHLGHSVTGAGKKRDKIKKAIREAKLAMKEAADYVVELKKEQVRAQKSLEKAELNLARLKAKLDAAKGE